MPRLSPFHAEAHQVEREDATIVGALDMWSAWHADSSPLGATGDYALDMLLADAFRHLLYRRTANDRLDWIQREISRPRRRDLDHRYHAELISWWLEIFETSKAPGIVIRMDQRRSTCVS